MDELTVVMVVAAGLCVGARVRACVGARVCGPRYLVEGLGGKARSNLLRDFITIHSLFKYVFFLLLLLLL